MSSYGQIFGAVPLATGVSGVLPAANGGTGTALGFPYFQAYKAASQTGVANATPVKLTLDTKTFDSNTWFDAVTNSRYTPLLAGKYRFTVNIYGTGTAVTRVSAFLYKNGAGVAQNDFFTAAIGSEMGILTVIMSMNGTTDYVEAFGLVSASSGNAFSGGNAPLNTWFEGSYVAA